jgi:uncharacterized protein YgiM (DUF1202 family)
MLVQDGDGRWYDDAGGTGSYHYETQDAASKAMGGGGGGGAGAAAGNAMVGGLLLIAIFGPIIAAKLVGLLWGLLLKLGIVGKVITSLLMLIAGPFIVLLPVMFAQPLLRNFSGGAVVSNTFVFGLVFFAPVWYFFWHYDVVKVMGAKVFSAKVQKFAMFLWFGMLGSLIIGFFKGQALQPILSLGASIAGFVNYFISVKPYAQEVERTGSFKFRYIGLAVAAGLTVAFCLLNIAGRARGDRELAQAQQQFAATVANPDGQTFTVYTATLNLRAEPSANGRVVRTLNKNDTVKATGKYSGVWIPVESGSDRGYVFALALSLDYEPITGTLSPFDAATAVPIQLYVDNRGIYEKADELRQDSTVTVLGNHNWRGDNYIQIAVNNRDYYIYADAAETLVPQLNADGTVATLSKDTPPQFNRKMPFQATVTEAISAIIRDGSGNWMSIPSGATVTVTGGESVYGISKASVTYNGQESSIHWRYLKLAE